MRITRSERGMMNICDFIQEVLDNNRLIDMQSMGHFRPFSFLGINLGYERWGMTKPASMITASGDCYKPLSLGLWIKAKGEK